MKTFWYGVTAVCLTSAFFTQLAQDKCLITLIWGLDWKWQFAGEMIATLAALALGARSQGKSSSSDIGR